MSSTATKAKSVTLAGRRQKIAAPGPDHLRGLAPLLARPGLAEGLRARFGHLGAEARGDHWIMALDLAARAARGYAVSRRRGRR